MRKIYGLAGVGIVAVVMAAASGQTTNTFPARGNVGIGTTNPVATLDVVTNLSQSPAGGIQVDGSDSHTVRLYPSLGGGNYNYIVQPGDQGIIYSNGTAGTGAFVIAPMMISTSGIRMDNNCNVGIGIPFPSAKLEVDGNIKLTSGSGASITFADGTVQSTAYTGVACGGDYAEKVNVTGGRKHFAPGDVLVVDPSHPGQFLKSATPYATAVAGVYSTKPGFVGHAVGMPNTKNQVPMAMLGIVPTYVTAANGPIHRGDLLVTSSRIGYAMKGTDRSRLTGAVIGKALGSLDTGTGKIEVLVTLQ